ncbi:MAG: serine hydrolase, partial [bacterium]|nr:serine hydrolase [bacterium]
MSKLWLYYVLTLILFLFLLILTSWFVFPVFSKSAINIVAPLPSFLNRLENDQVSMLGLWLPQVDNVKGSATEKPEIRAEAAISYDLTTSQTLFEKNIKKRLPMASLTKIMTAVIALENKKENDRYLVLKDSLVGENSMGLTEGEILSLPDLLHGLLLVSGNDAAEVLAQNFPQGREKFIEAMNKKAKALGLTDTNFTNPSGLEGDGDQYTTAYDLLVITKYALSNFELFRKIVSTFEFTVPYSSDHKEFYLQNETNLLTSYPGVKGVKDGYTPEAGLCLV